MRCFIAEFGGAVQPKLFFNVRLVRFDCFHAEVQFSCEARCAESAPDQKKNLQLAIT